MYFTIDIIGELNNDERGTFGDMFGGANALFSGLAFTGIIVTILLQREDLKETKKEMKRSADAQVESEKQFRKQSENLKITARLNALDTLVNYYARVEDKNPSDPKKVRNAKQKQSDYIKEIENILKRKQD